MVKFNRPLTDFDVIVGIDLATYRTGVCVYNIKTRQMDQFFEVVVSKNSECKVASLFGQLNLMWENLLTKYGKILVIIERLPQQCGVASTVATLQSLAKSHAIMELSVSQQFHVELYDEYGIHTTSVKSFFRTDKCPKPQKEDLRRAMVEYYHLDNDALTDNISDAMAVVHVLVHKRWNADIDDHIKEIKKEIKKLKAKNAISARQAEIERLLALKI